MLLDFITGAHGFVDQGTSSDMLVGWDGFSGNPPGSLLFTYPTTTFTGTGSIGETGLQVIGSQTWRDFGVAGDEKVTHVILNSFDVMFRGRTRTGTALGDTLTLDIVDDAGTPVCTTTLFVSGLTYSTAWATYSANVTGEVSGDYQAVDSQFRISAQYTVTGEDVTIEATSTTPSSPYILGPSSEAYLEPPLTETYINGLAIDNISITLVKASTGSPPVDPPSGAPDRQKPSMQAPHIVSTSGSYGLDLYPVINYRGAKKSEELLRLVRSSLFDIKLIQDTSETVAATLLAGATAFDSVEDSMIETIQHARAQILWRSGKW